MPDQENETVVCAMDTHAPDCDGYTTEPTHLRVYQEGGEWWIDGADNVLHYTEDVRTFSTFAEAVAFIPAFIEDNKGVVTWQWDNQRTTPIRHADFY